LFKYETFWRDDYKKALERSPHYWGKNWWELFYPTSFDIHNNIVFIGGLFLGTILT
jgi:hypothetical protein